MDSSQEEECEILCRKEADAGCSLLSQKQTGTTGCWWKKGSSPRVTPSTHEYKAAYCYFVPCDSDVDCRNHSPYCIGGYCRDRTKDGTPCVVRFHGKMDWQTHAPFFYGLRFMELVIPKHLQYL